MTYHTPIAADRSTSIQRVADRVEASLDAQALAAQHIAALETVPLLTDMPTTVQRARDLLNEIRLGGGHYATLGRNGIAPAVHDCVRSAGFHGFDWRARA